jgi:hypothetical protein
MRLWLLTLDVTTMQRSLWCEMYGDGLMLPQVPVMIAKLLVLI